MSALKLHQKAMELSSQQKYKEAYPLEKEAADSTTEEPTRSILYRSAGWQAYKAGLYRDALAMANKGLAGVKDASTKKELEDLIVACFVLEPRLYTNTNK